MVPASTEEAALQRDIKVVLEKALSPEHPQVPHLGSHSKNREELMCPKPKL